jgi:hypothetical protein
LANRKSTLLSADLEEMYQKQGQKGKNSNLVLKVADGKVT